VFAITSLKPDGQHWFLGDFDMDVPMRLKAIVDPRSWIIQSSKGNYHVICFAVSLSLGELLHLQRLWGCDPAFIRTTQKHGFAQLTLHGKIIKEGDIPKERIMLVKYTP